MLADFVDSQTGTGIVHWAPAFGEDDFLVWNKYKIIKPDNPPCPVDINGRFTSEAPDFNGMYIKDADKVIKEYLKKENKMMFN